MVEEGQNSAAAGDKKKPAILIIGGLGYIGRFLALHIHQNNLASEVRLVDKVLPQLAWLAPEFQEACSQDKFVQADASREQSLPRIFDRSNGEEFDCVFNLGGETRYSQQEEIYRLRSYELSMNLGREAARRHIQVFVECSTGMVYKPDPHPRKEGDKLKPWMKMAKWKLSAEEDLAKIQGLNLVILRMAHVYGDYSSHFISTALALARVYKAIDKELKWLWDGDLRVNTVHISDVVRATWRAAEWYAFEKANWDASMGPVPIFNIVDHGDTCQGDLAKHIGSIFDITTGFQGTLISSFARLHIDHVVDDINEEVLPVWADLLQKKGIERPGPLTPFMEKELLKETHLCLDGSRFEKVTGFQYKRLEMDEKGLRECVESYERMGWWP
ncbi:MAG: hypothetical protein M1834_001666 [Cirrosporium novae-zelandiae]|nr:MAG: hypothetical protein M1834_001666 [Cirrosporium novae-zelandiae]